MNYVRLLIILGCGLVGCLLMWAGASWRGSVLDAKQLRLDLAESRAATQQALQATKRLQATLVFREKKNAATARAAASAASSLAAAASAAPAWANQPVPQEIQDALP